MRAPPGKWRGMRVFQIEPKSKSGIRVRQDAGFA